MRFWGLVDGIVANSPRRYSLHARWACVSLHIKRPLGVRQFPSSIKWGEGKCRGARRGTLGTIWKIGGGFCLRIYRSILKFARFYIAILPAWRISFGQYGDRRVLGCISSRGDLGTRAIWGDTKDSVSTLTSAEEVALVCVGK